MTPTRRASKILKPRGSASSRSAGELPDLAARKSVAPGARLRTTPWRGSLGSTASVATWRTEGRYRQAANRPENSRPGDHPGAADAHRLPAEESFSAKVQAALRNEFGGQQSTSRGESMRQTRRSTTRSPTRSGRACAPDSAPEPCAVVIFGASGDWPTASWCRRSTTGGGAHSPAAFGHRRRFEERLFHEDSRRGCARRMGRFPHRPVDRRLWQDFAAASSLAGSFDDRGPFARAAGAARRAGQGALQPAATASNISPTPPSTFPTLLKQLKAAG